MEYRRLGGSGLKVSALSFGTMTFGMGQVDQDGAEELLKTAYDAGINFFDSAEAYGRGVAETVTGIALQKLGLPRDGYCVSSKVFGGSVNDPRPTQRGLSRKHVTDACHQALERLQVDYLDLYFCHRPDVEVPVEETVRTMSDLIAQGKILYWGTSEWSAAQLMEAHGVARQFGLIPPTMEQPQYNILHRERFEVEYAHLYAEIGLGTTIWGPVAGGMLTGKYDDGMPEGTRYTMGGNNNMRRRRLESEDGKRRLSLARELSKVAKEAGMKPSHMALAWCLENPNVSTVMMGASSLDQLTDNLAVLDEREKLTPDVKDKIAEVTG